VVEYLLDTIIKKL